MPNDLSKSCPLHCTGLQPVIAMNFIQRVVLWVASWFRSSYEPLLTNDELLSIAAAEVRQLSPHSKLTPRRVRRSMKKALRKMFNGQDFSMLSAWDIGLPSGTL